MTQFQYQLTGLANDKDLGFHLAAKFSPAVGQLRGRHISNKLPVLRRHFEVGDCSYVSHKSPAIHFLSVAAMSQPF